MNASPPSSPIEKNRLDGYRAIAECLSVCFGRTVSKDAAYRYATRANHPLPVDGYTGRVWTLRPVVEAWAKAELQRQQKASKRPAGGKAWLARR